VHVVGPQPGQYGAEFVRRVTCRPRAELCADDDVAAPRPETGDRLAHGVGPARLVGHTGPVEEVHAAVYGREHVVGHQGTPAARRRPEPAHGHAEDRRRAGEERTDGGHRRAVLAGRGQDTTPNGAATLGSRLIALLWSRRIGSMAVVVITSAAGE